MSQQIPHSLIPTPKLENDFYDWWARHEEKVQLVKANPHFKTVFIGDSITHLFEVMTHANTSRGGKLWKEHFTKYEPLNLGFGWDRTQNVLWRLDHGEVTGLQPKVFVILLGTNNLTGTANCRASTPEEIVLGIQTICQKLGGLFPQSHLILQTILPRGEAKDPLRHKIAEVNASLHRFPKQFLNLTLLDFGKKFLAPDGSISKELMNDLVHPTEQGYQFWVEALLPEIEKIFKQ